MPWWRWWWEPGNALERSLLVFSPLTRIGNETDLSTSSLIFSPWSWMAKEFGRFISSLVFLFFDLRNKWQKNNMKSSTKMEPIAIPAGIAILPWRSMYGRIKNLCHSQGKHLEGGVRDVLWLESASCRYKQIWWGNPRLRRALFEWNKSLSGCLKQGNRKSLRRYGFHISMYIF